MGIFGKRENNNDQNKIISKEKNDESLILEKPRICCLDIAKDDIELLTNSGFNIYSGSLGKRIKVPNTRSKENHQVLLNFDFPPNLHEYDIIIIDLDNAQTIDYKPEDHIREDHTGKSAVALLSSFPETVFDPRPLSSGILNNHINQIGKKNHLFLTFTTSSYEVEYEPVKITEGYISRQDIRKERIYSFLDYVPISRVKYGKEMIVTDIKADLKKLLLKHLEDASYNQIFHHPTKWENNKNVLDPNFIPLIKNSDDEIVSIFEARENFYIFFFPQIKLKGNFIKDFLIDIGPNLVPDLFPYSTTFSWKSDENYLLPNQEKLIEEKKKIQTEYDSKLKLKDDEILNNYDRFSFLHEILTETGDKLVDALIKYFKWLGFLKVIKVDEENTSSVLEEDIQVELENGLLVIECKGIGSTSSDSDCSQISKIKHRRCKERRSFDVYALYIVNHQRFLPPIKRQNPPFTKNQRQDALNDERGLLTTWQLFNLYFEIEEGIISKDYARSCLLKFGLVEFQPTDLILIDEPKEIFKDGFVCIVNIKNVELNIGDRILIEKNGKFNFATIESIQLNNQQVSNVKDGEVGLKLTKPISKKSVLWKK